MKKWKILVGILVVLALVIVPVSGVFASTTADVTITATPAYIAIAMASGNSSYDFGYVNTSNSYSTTTSYFNVVNTSNVHTDNQIKVTSATWAGGTTWTHVDGGVPGSGNNSVSMLANKGGTWGVSDVNVNGTGSFADISSNVGETTDWAFGLKLVTTTGAFTDTAQKSNTVRITARLQGT